MRKILLFGAAALIGIIGTDPAFCFQNGMSTTAQTQPEPPAGPAAPPVPPMEDPSQPVPPMTEPLPPEMPPAAGEARDVPSKPNSNPTMNSDSPMGPMATPPSGNDKQMVSGGTTRAMMMPQPATKAYPLCTRTLQDSCRNPGEGPSKTRKRRR